MLYAFAVFALSVVASQELNPWKKDKGIVGLTSKFAIAQTTAIIAGFISYPFDTVRRRLQMQAEKVWRLTSFVPPPSFDSSLSFSHVDV